MDRRSRHGERPSQGLALIDDECWLDGLPLQHIVGTVGGWVVWHQICRVRRPLAGSSRDAEVAFG